MTKLFFYKKEFVKMFSVLSQELLYKNDWKPVWRKFRPSTNISTNHKTAQHLKFKLCFVIGSNTSRRSKYPSNWLSVRLLYKSTRVCKLQVLVFLFIHVLSNFLPTLYSCLPKQYWWLAVECGRKIHKLSYYQNIFHPQRLNQSLSYFLCCQIVQASLWWKKLPDHRSI